MKKIYIVANWKSNKTESDAKRWLEGFKTEDFGLKDNEKEVIVCPPCTLLSLVKSYIVHHKSDFILGAQDVSPFPLGAYTGEIAAAQLKEFVRYTIVGHSERRKYFHEENTMLANKVDMLLEQGIMPIFCMRSSEDIVPKGVTMVAYEPSFAIGTGESDTPENAEEIAQKIKENNKAIKVVLYGGSVTDENVSSFVTKDSIDGVLVGSASLDINSFIRLVQKAESV